MSDSLSPQTERFMSRTGKSERPVEMEQIEEVAKPKAPASTHKIVQVKDVKVGDIIYLHTLGSGPYKVESLSVPNHPALKGSLVVIEGSRFNPVAKAWEDPSPLSYQFTQSHMDVELWDEPKTRIAFGLPIVPLSRVEGQTRV